MGHSPLSRSLQLLPYPPLKSHPNVLRLRCCGRVTTNVSCGACCVPVSRSHHCAPAVSPPIGSPACVDLLSPRPFVYTQVRVSPSGSVCSILAESAAHAIPSLCAFPRMSLCAPQCSPPAACPANPACNAEQDGELRRLQCVRARAALGTHARTRTRRRTRGPRTHARPRARTHARTHAQ